MTKMRVQVANIGFGSKLISDSGSLKKLFDIDFAGPGPETAPGAHGLRECCPGGAGDTYRLAQKQAFQTRQKILQMAAEPLPERGSRHRWRGRQISGPGLYVVKNFELSGFIGRLDDKEIKAQAGL